MKRLRDTKVKKAFWGTVLPIASAAIGAIGSIVAGNEQAKAQQEALRKQQEAQMRALNLQNLQSSATSINNYYGNYTPTEQYYSYAKGGCIGRRKLKLGGGAALPLGNNTFLLRGRSHEDGGIKLKLGGKTKAEVQGDEVVRGDNGNLLVYSNELPIGPNGETPAEMAVADANNPQQLDRDFIMQEVYKQALGLNDDGTTKASSPLRKKHSIKKAPYGTALSAFPGYDAFSTLYSRKPVFPGSDAVYSMYNMKQSQPSTNGSTYDYNIGTGRKGPFAYNTWQDWVGLGANTAFSLLAKTTSNTNINRLRSIIGDYKRQLAGYRYNPSSYTGLNTYVDDGAQRALMQRTYADQIRNTARNTASASTSVSRMNDLATERQLNINKVLEDTRNKNTELRVEDAKLRAQNAIANAEGQSRFNQALMNAQMQLLGAETGVEDSNAYSNAEMYNSLGEGIRGFLQSGIDRKNLYDSYRLAAALSTPETWDRLSMFLPDLIKNNRRLRLRNASVSA